MKDSEANECLSQLKTMFPGWRAWVRTMDDIGPTVGVWCDALRTQRVDHVRAVIGQFIDGRRRPPRDFEYEQLVFSVVAAAREIADAEQTRERNRALIEQYKVDAQQAARDREIIPTGRRMHDAGQRIKRAIEQICTESGKSVSAWGPSERREYERQSAEILRDFQFGEDLKRYGEKTNTTNTTGGNQSGGGVEATAWHP